MTTLAVWFGGLILGCIVVTTLGFFALAALLVFGGPRGGK